MDYLKEKILREGHVIEEKYLKVDHFVNNQIDTLLLQKIGDEFARLFRGDRPTKIITVEASGIAFACVTAMAMEHIPVVIARKNVSKIVDADQYERQVYSFTKDKTYTVTIPKRFLSPDDRVLIIDDFLAAGNVSTAMIDIVNESRAQCVGVGVVVEKSFQSGRQKLEDSKVKVHALAQIRSLSNNKIELL